ncbi:SPOR domain-containing protein [Porphyrobacter sp. ULC335]|uniref:SPOR domain-containing protein n=1 Tax=Porphyrobacter sp. ULC335 TaxID=2854260 RepID=UPI00221F4705|nr:SPOR domain-containing protein [Porphyrobacter sp. ULC335]UYV17192.1 SPOR domain-containing protein [Porphyrobacter sp. ULC335]
MIDAEYEELDEGNGELDLADTDSLPWLESDEEDEEAGGLDTGQIMLFAAGLVALLGVVVGGVWWVSNRAVGGEAVADGSVIAAPAGPIKQRPDDPGGKEFAGTGNVAPVVGEGGSRPAVVADAPMPPLPGPAATPSAAATKPVPATSPSAAPVAGVGVQLAAYGTRARAEQGWTDVSRRTDALTGVKYRVVEGKVDIGTVYRLQAVTGSRAEADRLCAALKADGVDCQVK